MRAVVYILSLALGLDAVVALAQVEPAPAQAPTTQPTTQPGAQPTTQPHPAPPPGAELPPAPQTPVTAPPPADDAVPQAESPEQTPAAQTPATPAPVGASGAPAPSTPMPSPAPATPPRAVRIAEAPPPSGDLRTPHERSSVSLLVAVDGLLAGRGARDSSLDSRDFGGDATVWTEDYDAPARARLRGGVLIRPRTVPLSVAVTLGWSRSAETAERPQIGHVDLLGELWLRIGGDAVAFTPGGRLGFAMVFQEGGDNGSGLMIGLLPGVSIGLGEGLELRLAGGFEATAVTIRHDREIETADVWIHPALEAALIIGL